MAKDYNKVLQKYPNLTNVEGTLTQVVEEKMNMISAASNDDNIGVEDFRAIILYILNECKQTPKVKQAKLKVERMSSKNEICFFIVNSALAGENQRAM